MAQQSLIPLQQAEFDPASYIDPYGRLFQFEGQLYRGIRAAGAQFYGDLLENPLFQGLTREGKIVGTRRSASSLEEFELVLEHDTITPRTYCVEWPPEMLQAAGTLTLELAEELARQGKTLQDGSPYNVLFQGPRPVFVDVGSICLVEDKFLWRPYQQFCNLFLFPLYLYEAGLHSIARPFLYDFLRGVPYELCYRLLPWFQRWRPQTLARLSLPLGLDRAIKKLGLEEKLKSSLTRPVGQEERVRFFSGLRRDLTSLRLKPAQTIWSDYQEWPSFEQDEQWTPKQKAIRDVLQRLRPASVLDVACNQGWYSTLAARQGARVIALDQDESCVSQVYRRARQEGINILPLRVDVLQPPPAFGWRLKQFSSFFQRVKADMVLALALIHHLCLAQWQSFERVVELFDEFEPTTLVLEFVPAQDDRARPMWESKPEPVDWYHLEGLLQVLGRRYRDLEVLESFPAGRKLIVATR
ncbi:class I SAM-dependent methyltransferase [bacterium CPR1]|nr:class I SAM-dependent methyltransferase [bacterium CPR1]